MTTASWLLHPKAVEELRHATRWYEDRAGGIGAELVDAFERHLEAALAQAHPGTPVPYVRRGDVRWIAARCSGTLACLAPSMNRRGAT